MKTFETFILLTIGLINFLPLLGILGVKQLKKLYGIDLEDENIVLLMRHRAVLFGIIGGFIVCSCQHFSLLHIFLEQSAWEHLSYLLYP